MDRVALVATAWFAVWIVGGWQIGGLLLIPGTGALCGFVLALLTVFAWPWVLPRRIDDWMHDPHV